MDELIDQLISLQFKILLSLTSYSYPCNNFTPLDEKKLFEQLVLILDNNTTYNKIQYLFVAKDHNQTLEKYVITFKKYVSGMILGVLYSIDPASIVDNIGCVLTMLDFMDQEHESLKLLLKEKTPDSHKDFRAIDITTNDYGNELNTIQELEKVLDEKWKTDLEYFEKVKWVTFIRDVLLPLYLQDGSWLVGVEKSINSNKNSTNSWMAHHTLKFFRAQQDYDKNQICQNDVFECIHHQLYYQSKTNQNNFQFFPSFL